MPAEELHDLWQAITVIEAQEMLKEIQVSHYPHTTKSSQGRLRKSLIKKAYPESFKMTKVYTAEEAALKLQRALSG